MNSFQSVSSRPWTAWGLIIPAIILGALALMIYNASAQRSGPDFWKFEWPNTDFTKTNIDYVEVLSGGPPKDGIPSIDNPQFESIAAAQAKMAGTEPVIGLVVNGEARAYPLRILTWHEIVNDTVGGVPVAVTYCPLCNAAIVFDARIDGVASEFGTTGKLRRSDLIMYDRNSESWWQQFSGTGIVGEHTGKKLTVLPSRLESLDRFAARAPQGVVLKESQQHIRSYGSNPYVGYDSSARPFLFRGDLPQGIEPLARVVAVGDKAWSLQLLRERGRITDGNLTLSWVAGQNSALDTRQISQGRDVGNVIAQRRNADGSVSDVPYDVTFAFVFHAFRPEGRMIF